MDLCMLSNTQEQIFSTRKKVIAIQHHTVLFWTLLVPVIARFTRQLAVYVLPSLNSYVSDLTVTSLHTGFTRLCGFAFKGETFVVLTP